MHDGLITVESSYTVSQTLDRLETILREKGIRIFGRIDHSNEARKVGLEMPPCELLIFGNPKIGTPIMLAAPTAAIDLPSKALAWQDGTGKVWLSFNDPEHLKQRFQIEEKLMGPMRGLGTMIGQAAL